MDVTSTLMDVTLTFDLYNLIRSLVGVSEYSMLSSIEIAKAVHYEIT